MLDLKTVSTACLAAAWLMFSSTEAQAQTAVAGTYTLASVNGEDLPVVTETSNNCREEVLSGSITLDADGNWELEYVEQETCGSNVEEDEEREDGDYTPEGETVRFSDDTDDFDPNDLELDDLGVGTLTTDGLTVTLQDGETTLLFRR